MNLWHLLAIVPEDVKWAVGLGLPLLAGFVGWLLNLGARLARVESSVHGLQVEQAKAEARSDQTMELLHKVDKRLSEVATKIEVMALSGTSSPPAARRRRGGAV